MAVDANTASREALTALTGVGGELADAIIQARHFSSLHDLLSVSGIGPRSLERLTEQGLTVVPVADSVQEATCAEEPDQLNDGSIGREEETPDEQSYVEPPASAAATPQEEVGDRELAGAEESSQVSEGSVGEAETVQRQIYVEVPTGAPPMPHEVEGFDNELIEEYLRRRR